jgi:NTP pyrophosphatase (non-canonical NTP hydrolase)
MYDFLNALSRHFHKASREAGWWSEGEDRDKYVIATKFALIHSEVSEAFEGYRKDTMDSHLPGRPSIEVELADVLIRILDLAGALDLDLAGAVAAKENYNLVRADHKAEARAGEGGKRF